jgi:hypothetical protein
VGRLGVVDHYLDWLVERPGIHDFADYVPLGSTAAVRCHLDKALERPSAIFCKPMARLHADVLG